MISTRAASAMVGFVCSAAAVFASDAGALANYGQRNETFVPAATVRPEILPKKRSELNQSQRMTLPILSSSVSPAAERPARIEVTEHRSKLLLSTDVRRVEAQSMPVNAMNHRVSGFDAKGRLENPPIVAKYQNSIQVASVANSGRSVVIQRPGVLARLNQFVFPRNHNSSAEIPVISVSAGKATQP